MRRTPDRRVDEEVVIGEFLAELSKWNKFIKPLKFLHKVIKSLLWVEVMRN